MRVGDRVNARIGPGNVWAIGTINDGPASGVIRSGAWVTFYPPNWPAENAVAYWFDIEDLQPAKGK